ncbi:hypothetical protein [Hypericibacter sp.]|uniref:hypothetical protein n=1 Tax=Hypericibacter sp. TaxID=2705401 RepID=UPI003D6D3D30
MIYPGEEIREGGGYPALVKFEPGRAGQPLVVFVTGGGVLARIAYGHPQGRPADFLGHWLREEGYPFLARSYPLDHPVFDRVYPEFSVRDWGEQTAEIVAQTLETQGGPRQILVLAWSMAGRIAEPLAAALKRRGIAIELFVAMAAATTLPGLLPGMDQLRPSARGLARIEDGFASWLLQSLQGQNELAGHELIPDDLFRADFTGDLPINLAATSLRYRDGRFVPDPLADTDDIGASRYAGFPPLVLMTHDSALDVRHALMDRAAWGFYIAQTLCERHLWPQAPRLAALPTEQWQQILDLVRIAPEQLTVGMPGNHLFFVSEPGARATVAALNELRGRVRKITAALQMIAG